MTEQTRIQELEKDKMEVNGIIGEMLLPREGHFYYRENAVEDIVNLMQQKIRKGRNEERQAIAREIIDLINNTIEECPERISMPKLMEEIKRIGGI